MRAPPSQGSNVDGSRDMRRGTIPLANGVRGRGGEAVILLLAPLALLEEGARHAASRQARDVEGGVHTSTHQPVDRAWRSSSASPPRLLLLSSGNNITRHTRRGLGSPHSNPGITRGKDKPTGSRRWGSAPQPRRGSEVRLASIGVYPPDYR